MTHVESVESKGPAGAPEHEIEVTQAMVEEGVLALSGFDPEYESIEEAAIRIYRSMAAARTGPRVLEVCDQPRI